MEKISLDYGIMERAEKVAVIPADVGWSDVGSFTVLYEILDKGESGNAIKGNVQPFATRNCLLVSENGLVAALGLDRMAVINTGDAVLVCPLDRSQEVRSVAEHLLKLGCPEAVVRPRVYKPGALMKCWTLQKIIR